MYTAEKVPTNLYTYTSDTYAPIKKAKISINQIKQDHKEFNILNKPKEDLKELLKFKPIKKPWNMIEVQDMWEEIIEGKRYRYEGYVKVYRQKPYGESIGCLSNLQERFDLRLRPELKRRCMNSLRNIFGFINITGIENSSYYRKTIRNILINHDISVLGIAETWLRGNLNIEGYTWIGNNGPIVGNRGSGGTGILINKKYANSINSISSKSHRITAAVIDKTLLIVIYAPILTNNPGEEELNEYMKIFTNIQENLETEIYYERCIIMGDFNAHIKNYLNDKSDISGKIMIDFIKTKELFILNDQDMPTFKGNGRYTIIDYIFSNENSEIQYKEVPSLKTSQVLMTTEVHMQEIRTKNKSFIPWYKLEGEELKKLQERFDTYFQENQLYQKDDPKEIYNIISRGVQKETLNLKENLKPNYSRRPEVIILNEKINDIRNWISYCYKENEKEKAQILCLVRRKWQKRMEILENNDIVNLKWLDNCINDPYGAWKKIKMLSGKIDKIINPMNKRQIDEWTNEFATQFKDDDIVYLKDDFTNENPWSLNEIRYVIENLPNGKAPGPDNISYDILKKAKESY